VRLHSGLYLHGSGNRQDRISLALKANKGEHT